MAEPETIPDSKRPARKFRGLLVRRERWGLSMRGWAAMVLIFLALAVIGVFNVQPFLAPTRRVDSSVLVVEGWIHGFAIQGAVTEFQSGHYQKVFTTGGPVAGTGGYLNDYNTSASVGAESLVRAGIPPGLVQMVPTRISGRDRTYSSALALCEYFQTNGLAVKRFNVLTEDVHARRTWMLFQEAFGKNVQVGIISVPNPDYDPAHWWRYSEGVREILGESIAYVYAAFLFHPSAPPPE